MSNFFYKPVGAWAADFIPFCGGGQFHLFYLHDWRDAANHGEGTPWYLVSTEDFVRFTEHGEVLPRGAQDEQDLTATSRRKGSPSRPSYTLPATIC
ncbi:MAG: hypothetical protein IT210_00550 [Armatimonadetes bacterium]|nr:hypothetical protein [Armatimonadota bacterium]